MAEIIGSIFNQTKSINDLVVNSDNCYRHAPKMDDATNKKIGNNIYHNDASCTKLYCQEKYNNDGLVVKREFYNEEGGICYTEIFEHDKIETGKFVSTLYSGEGPNEYCDNVIGYRFYKDGCGSELKSDNYFTLVSPELKFNEDKKKVECADSEAFAILEKDVTPDKCYTILTELFKTDLQSKEYGNQITGTHIKTLAFFYLKKRMLQKDKDIDIYFKSFITDRNRGKVNLDCKVITDNYVDENKPKFIIRPINVNGHATAILIDRGNNKQYIFDSSLTHLEKYKRIFTNYDGLGNLNDVKNIDKLDGEKELQVNGCCSYWAMCFIEVITEKIILDKENNRETTIDDIINYAESGVMCLDIACKMSELFDNPKEKPTIQKIELNDSVGDDYIKLCVSDNDCYKLNKDAYKNKFLNLGGISKFVNNEEAKKELNKLIAKQEIVKDDNKSLMSKNIKLYSIADLQTEIKCETLNFDIDDSVIEETVEKIKIILNSYQEQYKQIKLNKIKSIYKATYDVLCPGGGNGELNGEEWDFINNNIIKWNEDGESWVLKEGYSNVLYNEGNKKFVVKDDKLKDANINGDRVEKVNEYVNKLINTFNDYNAINNSNLNLGDLLFENKQSSFVEKQMDFLDYLNKVKSFICYDNIDKFFDETNVLDNGIKEQIDELFKYQEEIMACVSNGRETTQDTKGADNQERYGKEEFLIPQESIVPNIKETLDGISPDIIERVKLVQKEFMDKVKIRCGVSKFDGMKMN